MEELITGTGEPSGGGGIEGGGGAPEPPRDAAAEGGKGGPGGEGGAAPWGRGFGEELSGLRESGGRGRVHTGTDTQRQERQKEKMSLGSPNGRLPFFLSDFPTAPPFHPFPSPEAAYCQTRAEPLIVVGGGG